MKQAIKSVFQRILHRLIKIPDYELNERSAEFSFLFSALSLGTGLKLLDVGAGTSPLPFLLAYCGYKVDAVDLEPNNYFVDVKKVDISAPRGYMEAAYDFVTCISVLEHIPDFNAAMRNMSRACKPGGMLILTTPYRHSGFVDNYMLDIDPHTTKLCRNFTEHNIDTWSRDNGLTLVEKVYYNTGVYTAPDYLRHKPRVAPAEKADLVCLAFRKDL